MVNDPIADFITQLKNAARVGKDTITVPYSRLKEEIALKLIQAGFVQAVEKRGKKTKKLLEVTLAYTERNKPRITEASRISKPSRRVYRHALDIRPVRHGKGIILLSTSRGILTGEEARKEGVGGEALFSMW